MKNYLLYILLCAFTSFGFAQATLEQANEKFAAEDWKGASEDYKSHLKKNKGDSAAWFNLALCQRSLKDYASSIKSFEKARKTNFSGFRVDFNQAKAYVLNGETDMMYTVMEASAANGFPAFVRLKNDPEFASVQEEERFKALVSTVEINAYPCLSNEDSRHFDFWIGEWDVYFNGRKVGDNSITRAQGGCAIHENYTTAGSYSGQSINFYSPVDQKWHQHWVGSSGDVYNYVETKRSEGYLQFESEFINPQGALTLSRLTFTLNEDGTVSQLFENSSDGGETWSQGFNGLYKRKD